MRKLSRRDLLRGVLATSLAVSGSALLAACGSATPTPAPAVPTQPQGGTAKAAPAPSTAPVKLTIWTYNFVTLTKQIERLVESYKTVKPNVEVEYSIAPVVDHDRKLMTTLAAGAGPDVFNQGDWNYSMMRAKNWVIPIDPTGFGKASHKELIDTYNSGVLLGLIDQTKGELYGAPVEGVHALSLYYHIPTFKEVGLDPSKPPTDWVTLTEYAIKLTKRDSTGNIQRPGYQIAYGPGTEWPLKRLHGMIMQLGGDVLSPDGKQCTVSSPEAREAIQLYTDWTLKHKVSQKGFSIPGIQGMEYFVNGYYPLQTNGPYYPRSLLNTKADFRYKQDWDIAPFPQWPGDKNKTRVSPLWRWAFFVNANGKAPKDASALIAYLGSDWRGFYDATGYPPAIKDWDKDPKILEANPWVPIQMKDLEVARPVPQTPKYQELAQQILEMLERIETGAQSVQASTEEAKRKIDAILQAP